MNKERHNQIIHEVYKNYIEKYKQDKTPGIVYYTNPIQYRPYTIEEFIHHIKTDNDLSEKWGLKIEERELSLEERGELFRKTYPYNSVDDFAPSGMEVQSIGHQLNARYDRANIPTSLIIVTYENKTIEGYGECKRIFITINRRTN
jgi:hypothetical protein